MNQDNAPITKENLRAVLCEEWLNILREELGENAPATIGDIRQMVREAICENPSVLVSDSASTMSETDVNAIAHRIVDIMRESGAAEAVQEAIAAAASGEDADSLRVYERRGFLRTLLSNPTDPDLSRRGRVALRANVGPVVYTYAAGGGKQVEVKVGKRDKNDPEALSTYVAGGGKQVEVKVGKRDKNDPEALSRQPGSAVTV